MTIAIICFPGCDVINFEITQIFVIKHVRKVKTKLENKKRIQGEIESIFYHF